MDTIGLGVLRERAPGERRVALTPDAVARLVGDASTGAQILAEPGCGEAAWFSDEEYVKAGAQLRSAAEIYAAADVIVTVGAPPGDVPWRSGQVVLGLLTPRLRPGAMAELAARGVVAVSLDGLPRTLSRAQGMDALSSQATVAGYKAVLVAAAHFDRFFPLLITAAGTARPAELLVLGAGVAGLQAIGTARRLGAVVRAYDVRPASRGEVESLGASFLQLAAAVSAAGEGGYARALTDDEQAAQQAELAAQIARHDIVITTAQVPGRRPPLLVTAEAVAAMRPGSVVVDLAASDLGGNVAGSRPDETLRSGNGVTIVGAGSLPSAMATAASASYARNVSAVLRHLLRDGVLTFDPDDEITRGVLVTHAGRIVHPDVADAARSAGVTEAREAAS